jgi:hypothetical protein
MAVVKEKPAARPKKAPGKAGGLDDLSALAASIKPYEDEIRAETGSSNSFITLVQGNTNILKPDSPSFIKGARLYDFVISKFGLRLGQSFEATVLGSFSLYTESEKKQKQGDMAKIVSFWMPEDAVQIPLISGSNFDRQLPNGNLLQQTHWVFLYLHKHPEIDDALISLRSYGNRVHKELQKELKAQSSLCSELRFTVGRQPIQSKAYDTTNYYPKFEVAGRNFDYRDDKVVSLKDGLPKDELAEVLRRSKELHETYKNLKMVGRKNIPAIVGSSPRAALAAPGGYEEEEEEAADVTF